MDKIANTLRWYTIAIPKERQNAPMADGKATIPRFAILAGD